MKTGGKWKAVALDSSGMEDFAKFGGLLIEELDEVSGLDVPEVFLKKKRKSKKDTVAPKRTKAIDEQIEPSEEKCGIIRADISLWLKIGVLEKVADSLGMLGFLSPTRIQECAIPPAMLGNDIIAAAETGSGKTLSFGIPIVSHLLDTSGESRALIVAPTRELAVQIKSHLLALINAGSLGLSIAVVVGGMSVQKQHRVLKKKPTIVIGTPGRLAGVLGLVKGAEAEEQVCEEFKNSLASFCSHLVLDEADRLLEDGHFRALKEILKFLPTKDRQTFVVSATLKVCEGNDLFMSSLSLQPKEKRSYIDLSNSSLAPVLPSSLTIKVVKIFEEKQRESVLLYLFLTQLFPASFTRIILFVNAISYVSRLVAVFKKIFGKSKNILGLSSKLKQKARLERIEKFSLATNNSPAILIATDVAARGLDIPLVDAVIHMQPPRDPSTIVHRSGRTARAGKEGVCFFLVVANDLPQWEKNVRNATGKNLDEFVNINIDQGVLMRSKRIMEIATKLEGAEHKESKLKKEKSWKRKMVQDCDLANSSDDEGEDLDDEGEEETDRGRTGKKIIENESLERELTDLLKDPSSKLRLNHNRVRKVKL